MSSIQVQGSSSGAGTITVVAPITANSRTLTLPDQNGTLLSSAGAISVNAATPASSLVFDAGGNIFVGGNLGVGTSLPLRKLVVSNGGAQGFEFGAGGGLSSGNELLNYNRSTGLYVQNTTYASAHVFYTGTAGAILAVNIDSTGNLLVGAPATYGGEKFGVTQSAAAAGILVRLSSGPYNSSSYAMVQGIDGTVVRFYFPSNGGLYNYSANNFNLASDVRLKKNIEPVKSYWNVFKTINWKTWLYNNQTDDIKNIGIIAQELQELAPELINESNILPTPEGESPYLGIWENDFKMAGMSVITELVKRCEEQQELIKQLTERITVLETRQG